MVGGVTVWVVIVVISCVISVAVSLFGIVLGGTDGGHESISGLIILGSFVVIGIAGSNWHPGKACRFV